MRRPIRAVAILIKDNEILLMWRNKEGKEYWTFPGGGVEGDEKIEEAIIRELREETTVEGKVEKLLYHQIYDHESDNNWGSEQYFYLCSYVLGEPKLREDSPEAEKMKTGTNLFEPQWVPLEKLTSLLLYPLEIRNWLIEDIKNNFADTPREATIKLSELREK